LPATLKFSPNDSGISWLQTENKNSVHRELFRIEFRTFFLTETSCEFEFLECSFQCKFEPSFGWILAGEVLVQQQQIVFGSYISQSIIDTIYLMSTNP
jgi:hypothetical protein